MSNNTWQKYHPNMNFHVFQSFRKYHKYLSDFLFCHPSWAIFSISSDLETSPIYTSSPTSPGRQGSTTCVRSHSILQWILYVSPEKFHILEAFPHKSHLTQPLLSASNPQTYFIHLDFHVFFVIQNLRNN